MKVVLYTTFALVAFAFNSILCRLALGSGAIDPASFTAVRLISGAIVLLLIISFAGRAAKAAEAKSGGNWLSAFFLFAYAICFSLAYMNLTTATGALVLFGSVQLTMLGAALVKGERPSILEWLGLFFALGGLVYLVFPGLSAPPLSSSALMTAAGAAWGFYTLRGRGSLNPLAETAGNFLRSVPMIILLALPFVYRIHLSAEGIVFAVLSGAIASGIGYAVWYAALKYHTAARAAILQLSVPALAAIGGVIFLAEAISMRLWLASALILGGIALSISGKVKPQANTD
ncbi:MAG TPA: DMT family transporter [Pyrinomonadaceae bacterium]|nr:DMT family transporter [Pyrinomonadaceae bacterium]